MTHTLSYHLKISSSEHYFLSRGSQKTCLISPLKPRMNFHTHQIYKDLRFESMYLQSWQLEYKIKTTDRHQSSVLQRLCSQILHVWRWLNSEKANIKSQG
uniref:Uncharacterized protein n=1 Tax=Micrurus spixii TaxID=129469 RepID=A0A2D4NHG3_9SAUR